MYYNARWPPGSVIKLVLDYGKLIVSISWVLSWNQPTTTISYERVQYSAPLRLNIV